MSVEEERVVITDDHKKLVFSFIKMMRTLKPSEEDRAQAIVQLLGEEFDIDPAGVGGVHDNGIDLFPTFMAAVEHKAKTDDVEKDEKFKAFVELLEKKGYFKGVEKDTEEYKHRLDKAREKFNARNNPYEGLTAEQIKNKGNELMSQAKYKEAIAYYTKAIEMEPENSIFFANRAAAHTHLKDYNSAIIDCERSVILNPSYSKAYSRMGTAYFYQDNYSRAVDAFAKAVELDPTNATYKDDLARAEEKLKSSGAAAPAAANPFNMGPMGAMGGGMPDMGQFAQMMQNPQFMESAQRMMQNPEFSSMVANMSRQMQSGGGLTPDMLNGNFDPSAVVSQEPDEDGNVSTPFGKINRAAIQKLQEEEVRKNPRMASIMADVQANGYGAFQKYLGDPDVMNLMMKFQQIMFSGGQGGDSS